MIELVDDFPIEGDFQGVVLVFVFVAMLGENAVSEVVSEMVLDLGNEDFWLVVKILKKFFVIDAVTLIGVDEYRVEATDLGL